MSHAASLANRLRGGKGVVLGLALAAGLLAVVAATVPTIVARRAAASLGSALRTSVRVGSLAWNPFTGTWTLDGLRVAAEHGPAAFSARRVRATVWVIDLLRGRRRVRALTLAGARLRLRATPGGWELPLPASDASGDAGLPAVDVDWAGAPRARIRLEAAPEGRSSLRLRQLELTGTLSPAGTNATVWTRGRLDRGGVALGGRLRTAAATRRVKLRLAATDLDVARILKLAQVTAIRDLRGRVDLKARYDEAGEPGSIVRRAVGQMRGHDVALGAPAIEAVSVHDVDVRRFDLDLGRRAVALGAVRVRGAEVWVRGAGVPSGPGGEPAWVVTVTGATVDGGVVHYIDPNGAPPIDVTVEQARLDRVGAPDAPVHVSLAATVATGGHLALDGDVVRLPLGATGQVRADDVVLPALVETLRLPVRLESGRLTVAAQVVFRDGAVRGSGDVTIADVKTISPDPAAPEDVMAVQTIRLRVRDAGTNPPAVDVDSLEIAWPYVLIDRRPDAIFPLTVLPASRGPTVTPPNLRIGHGSVIGARIDFRDLTMTPPYWRALAGLRIDARTIEAPAVRIAQVDASGLIDELSPLRVHGTVGTRTELVAEVERLALPPFNAYLAEGNAPYVVASGLVSGRSTVVLERSQLEVDNQVVLSRLGLGGSVGPDFVQRDVGIPLTLALALMKDYRGDIALALPFGGDLREPSFDLRSVVIQAVVRAIRGAVLSPLNALGRVFMRDGRIESIALDSIPFAAGARTLDTSGRQRVEQVARVLTVHPELGVRLRGVAAGPDLERLRDEAVLSALARASDATRLRAYVEARASGSPPPPISDAEHARLDALYAGLPFPGAALQALAEDRGAVAAAALILEQHVDPARVTPVRPELPGPDDLAPAPEANVEL